MTQQIPEKYSKEINGTYLSTKAVQSINDLIDQANKINPDLTKNFTTVNPTQLNKSIRSKLNNVVQTCWNIVHASTNTNIPTVHTIPTIPDTPLITNTPEISTTTDIIGLSLDNNDTIQTLSSNENIVEILTTNNNENILPNKPIITNLESPDFQILVNENQVATEHTPMPTQIITEEIQVSANTVVEQIESSNQIINTLEDIDNNKNKLLSMYTKNLSEKNPVKSITRHESTWKYNFTDKKNGVSKAKIKSSKDLSKLIEMSKDVTREKFRTSKKFVGEKSNGKTSILELSSVSLIDKINYDNEVILVFLFKRNIIFDFLHILSMIETPKYNLQSLFHNYSKNIEYFMFQKNSYGKVSNITEGIDGYFTRYFITEETMYNICSKVKSKYTTTFVTNVRPLLEPIKTKLAEKRAERLNKKNKKISSITKEVSSVFIDNNSSSNSSSIDNDFQVSQPENHVSLINENINVSSQNLNRDNMITNKDIIKNVLNNNELDGDQKVSIMKKINNNLQLVTQLEMHKEDTKRTELKMNKKIELLKLKIQLENVKKSRNNANNVCSNSS